MSKQSRPRKETNSKKEFLRSNLLTLSERLTLENEDLSTTFLDDTNIEIIISSDHGLEQAPVVDVTSATASQQDENKGVNEMFLEDKKRILREKRELYTHVVCDEWFKAKAIYDRSPHMVRIPLTVAGDRVLHVAVSSNSNDVMKELINLLLKKAPEVLKIPNAEEKTATSTAAISGNRDFFKILIARHQTDLLLIPGPDGLLPVHLTAMNGHYSIVCRLSSEDLLEKMDLLHIKQLFFMTIRSSMYDMPEDNNFLAVHQRFQQFVKTFLLEELWSHFRMSEHEEILD